MSVTENHFLSLVAHKVAPFQFDIGFGAVNASIRDQIVRAQMVVRGLKSLEETKPPDDRRQRPLLICGAGIAGLAAADEAERLNLGFVLIDKSNYPSGALSGNGNRYLSPTMYEWPASLFDEHRHPRKPASFLGADKESRFELPFDTPVLIAALKDQIDKLVKVRLHKWLSNGDSAVENCYLPETTISDGSKIALQKLLDADREDEMLDEGLPPIHVTKTGAGDKQLECSYILFAGGFAEETTEYEGQTFDTPAFWQEDKLTERHLGMKDRKRRVSAFIAGAGDGAIQDALRCLVDPQKAAHPIELWKKIIAGARFQARKGCRHGTLDSLLREVLSVDNYATGAFMWSGDKEVFASIDEIFQQLCSALLAQAPGIQKNIADLLRNDVEIVHIQRNRPYFTRCYALNRFLIHLMAAALQKLGRRPVLTFGDGKPKRFRKEEDHIVFGNRKYHVVVVRTGSRKEKDDEHFQTIGLTRIDPARISFGRIPPPFMPAKKKASKDSSA